MGVSHCKSLHAAKLACISHIDTLVDALGVSFSFEMMHHTGLKCWQTQHMHNGIWWILRVRHCRVYAESRHPQHKQKLVRCPSDIFCKVSCSYSFCTRLSGEQYTKVMHDLINLFALFVCCFVGDQSQTKNFDDKLWL